MVTRLMTKNLNKESESIANNIWGSSSFKAPFSSVILRPHQHNEKGEAH
jgi:hypothetical protein